jgi:hypothetical protein
MLTDSPMLYLKEISTFSSLNLCPIFWAHYNAHYFKKLSQARDIIPNWWKEYNEERPQKRLKGMTPKQYNDSLIIEKTKLECGQISG